MFDLCGLLLVVNYLCCLLVSDICLFRVLSDLCLTDINFYFGFVLSVTLLVCVTVLRKVRSYNAGEGVG